MEKIKQAILKAKGLAPQASKAQPAPLVKSAEKVASTPRLGSDEQDLGSLEYTNTKVVTLNPLVLERNRIVAFDKSNKLSSLFDLLRTQILQKMEENGWRTIAVVSPTPESGKTFVSINLAMSIAHQPQKSVVLVDFDLRRPKVATYLGLSTSTSMNDYLEGGIDLGDVMVNPSIPRMVVLPTNKPVQKSSETLSSEIVTNLVTELRERYSSRIVVFDLPPVLAVDDAMVILPQVDCVLLVVSNGMNTESEVVETKRRLAGQNLIGVVLNKAEVLQQTYYY